MICHRPENVLSLFSRWYLWFSETEKSCSFTFLATAVVRLQAKGRSCTFPCQTFISSDCGSGLCFLVRQHDWKCKYMNWSVVSDPVFPKCVMLCVKANLDVFKHPPSRSSFSSPFLCQIFMYPTEYMYITMYIFLY